MAEQTHTVVVKFEGRDAGRGIDALEQSMRRAAKAGSDFQTAMAKAASQFDAFGTRMTTFGTRLSIGVTAPLVAAGVALFRLGANAVESENLFSVSFGRMAGAARAWSEQTSRALGLNAFELRKTSGTIFTMVEAMGLGEKAAFDMATGISELAHDLASFFNLRPEEAFDKLRSGIVGEAEPLRQLGILIDENTVKQAAYAAGIAKVGDELTAQQKVQARWIAILNQTGKAQGDLARTLDSPTNMLRRLGESAEQVGIKLGTALLPMAQQVLAAVERFVPVIERAVDRFSALPPHVQQNAIMAAAFAAALGPLLVVLGQVSIGISGLIKATAALPAIIAGLTNSIPVLTARIWLLEKGLTAVLAKMSIFAAIATTVAAGINYLINAYKDQADEAIAAAVGTSRLAASIADLRKEIAAGQGVRVKTMEQAKEAIKLIDQERANVKELLNARKIEGAEALAREQQLVAIRDQLTLLIIEGGKHTQILEDEAAAMEAGGNAAEDAAKRRERLEALLDQSVRDAQVRRAALDYLTRGLEEFAARSREAAEAFSDLLNKQIVAGIRPIPNDPGRVDPNRGRGAPRSTREVEEEARKAAEAHQRAAAESAEAWFRAAQIMGDAIGNAFGEMGSKVSRFVNQLIQVVGLMQQMGQIAGATGGSGGGWLSGLFGMFGGGGGGRAAYNPAANSYFSSWGARPPGGGGGMFSGGGFGGALMGAGIGAGIGGLGSMLGLGGYAQEGGTIGGAIGGGIGGPVGAAIGGALGTIAGSLINRGADEALGAIDAFTGKLNMTKAEGEAGKALQAVGDAIAGGLAQFNEMLGGLIPKFGAPGLKFRDGVYSVFGGGDAFRTEDQAAAAAEAMFRAIKNADLSQVSEMVRQAILHPLSDTFDKLQRNVQVALSIEKLGVPEFARGIQETIRSLEDLKKAGIELGLDIGKVDDEIARVLRDAAQDYSSRLLGFLGDYYDSARVGEELRRSMEQANFQIRYAQLRIEFETLRALGAFSAEVLAQIQGVFEWIDANPPTFADPAATAERERRRGERERRQQERQDAIEEGMNALGGPMEALADRYRELGETIDFLRKQTAAGRLEVERFNEAMAALAAEEYVAFGDRLLGFIDRYFKSSLLGEELRADVIRANQVLEWANLKAQFALLQSLGLLTQAQIALVAGVIEQVEAAMLMVTIALEPPPPAPEPEPPPGLAENTAALQENTDALREAAQDFHSMWADLVLGTTAGADDPVAQLAAKFAAMRQAFQQQSLYQQGAFLVDQNVSGLRIDPTGQGWLYNGQPLSHVIATQLYDALVRPIENLKLDELFQSLEAERLKPIRDLFDELRTQAPGMTRTQRYDAAYRSFLEAAAAGNIEQSTSLGRQLLMDLGVQQFGASSQGYRDLYDLVVRTLGGFTPEGPPEDLLARSVQVQQDSRALLQQNHEDNAAILAELRENNRLLRRATTSKREGGSFGS